MEPKELEEYLNTVIDDLYRGLKRVAAKVRGDGSREDIAQAIEAMAGDICQHWPNCINGASPSQVAQKRS